MYVQTERKAHEFTTLYVNVLKLVTENTEQYYTLNRLCVLITHRYGCAQDAPQISFTQNAVQNMCSNKRHPKMLGIISIFEDLYFP